MTDYTNHADVLKTLQYDQEAEKDLREIIAEVVAFVYKLDGQWEPDIIEMFYKRPRYTFDQTKPAIAKVWGEMAANDYSAVTQPVSNGATEDVAKILDGYIRNTKDVSGFSDIGKRAGKLMIATGFSAWRLAALREGETFNQDLRILPLYNPHERVWFQSGSEMQTREDSDHVNLLSAVNKSKCEKRWPDREGDFSSLSETRTNSTQSYVPQDQIIVSEILYKKYSTKMIFLHEDGAVLDEDGLLQQGLTEESPEIVDSREVEVARVYSRKFDNKGWLEPEKATVFTKLPVIPCYANFDISENKVTYEGLVAPLMDACRIYNYSESRKVEENILAARAKLMVDDRLVEGRVDEFSNLNRDPASVQLYKGGVRDAAGNPAPTPFMTPGPQANPGVSELSDSAMRNIQLTAGLPNEMENLQRTGRDSDFRASNRNSMGQIGTFEYYNGYKVALEHTAKVILGAVPNMIDAERKIMTIDESGKPSEVMVNETNAEGDIVNNIRTGVYDVTVDIGPTMESRQEATNDKIIELGGIDPGVVNRNMDVIANNVKSPGMNTVAARERARLMREGVIPESEWTEDEKAMAAEAKANSQGNPDPAVMIGQAEVQKAQTEAKTAQTRQLEAQAKLELQQQKQQSEELFKANQAQQDQINDTMNNLKTLVDVLKNIHEAQSMPVDTEIAVQGERLVNQAQDQLSGEL